MIPVMADLKPYCTKFHIHNEPNHRDRYEGWSPTDDDARDFNAWFLDVYRRLKEAHPWASIGFPGLALPHFGHRDRTVAGDLPAGHPAGRLAGRTLLLANPARQGAAVDGRSAWV